jgi:hypothetical protein
MDRWIQGYHICMNRWNQGYHMITLISPIHTYMITLIFNNRKMHSIGSIRLLILQ